MTNKEFAKGRNWQKARLRGFVIDKRFITTDEEEIIKEIRERINILLDCWDDESEALGMKIERFNLYLPDGKLFYESVPRDSITHFFRPLDKKERRKYRVEKCK